MQGPIGELGVSGVAGRAKSSSAKATDGVQRRPGGQPGNTNAWKHGRRSRDAELSRKLTCARLKLAAHILRAHAEAEGRPFQSHARPMRRDQLELLKREDPEGWSLVQARGLASRCWIRPNTFLGILGRGCSGRSPDVKTTRPDGVGPQMPMGEEPRP
jgi:hypothetical protein